MSSTFAAGVSCWGSNSTRRCPNLVKQALAAGLLINVTHDTVIRLLPPLILSDEQADEIVDA